MKRGKRRRLGADVWRELLAKFADSGLSVGAFCAQEGVSTSSFQWWRCRFNGSSRVQPSTNRSAVVPTSEFVDLGALSAPPTAPAERFELRLDLGGGLVLHLVRG